MPVYQYPECEWCEHVGTKEQCDVCYVDAFNRAEKRIAELETENARLQTVQAAQAEELMRLHELQKR